jgi:hypothetical protein
MSLRSTGYASTSYERWLSFGPGDLVARADYDDDGVPDIVAEIDCSVGYPSDRTVLVLTPDIGGARVLGIVAVAYTDANERITQVIHGSGEIDVFIETGGSGTQHTRYRWAGTKFVEVP